jgi:hypothetical protein
MGVRAGRAAGHDLDSCPGPGIAGQNLVRLQGHRSPRFIEMPRTRGIHRPAQAGNTTSRRGRPRHSARSCTLPFARRLNGDQRRSRSPPPVLRRVRRTFPRSQLVIGYCERDAPPQQDDSEGIRYADSVASLIDLVRRDGPPPSVRSTSEPSRSSGKSKAHASA